MKTMERKQTKPPLEKPRQAPQMKQVVKIKPLKMQVRVKRFERRGDELRLAGVVQDVLAELVDALKLAV